MKTQTVVSDAHSVPAIKPLALPSLVHRLCPIDNHLILTLSLSLALVRNTMRALADSRFVVMKRKQPRMANQTGLDNKDKLFSSSPSLFIVAVTVRDGGRGKTTEHKGTVGMASQESKRSKK